MSGRKGKSANSGNTGTRRKSKLDDKLDFLLKRSSSGGVNRDSNSNKPKKTRSKPSAPGTPKSDALLSLSKQMDSAAQQAQKSKVDDLASKLTKQLERASRLDDVERSLSRSQSRTHSRAHSIASSNDGSMHDFNSTVSGDDELSVYSHVSGMDNNTVSAMDPVYSKAADNLRKAEEFAATAATQEEKSTANTIVDRARAALKALEDMAIREHRRVELKGAKSLVKGAREKIARLRANSSGSRSQPSTPGADKSLKVPVASPTASAASVDSALEEFMTSGNAAMLDTALKAWYEEEFKSPSSAGLQSAAHPASGPPTSSSTDDAETSVSVSVEPVASGDDVVNGLVERIQTTDKVWMDNHPQASADVEARDAAEEQQIRELRRSIAKRLHVDTRKTSLELEAPKRVPKSPFSTLTRPMRKGRRRSLHDAFNGSVQYEKVPIPPDLRPMSEQELLAKIKAIRSNPELRAPPKPHPPDLAKYNTTEGRVRAIQRYIRSLEYNHTGIKFFNVEKRRSLSRIMETAKSVIQRALPIKCLEAVMVGLYLTRSMKTVTRFPLRFKSKVNGETFWHIVLALKDKVTGKLGAVGLSRRDTLDYKEIKYESLSDLAMAYISAYKEVGHRVQKITIGLPVGRQTFSHEPIFWHFFIIPLVQGDWPIVAPVMDEYCRSMLKLNEAVRRGAYVKPLKGFELLTVFDRENAKLLFLSKPERDLRLGVVKQTHPGYMKPLRRNSTTQGGAKGKGRRDKNKGKDKKGGRSHHLGV